MTSPRDILDERLVRGEITPEQHKELSGHIRDTEKAGPSRGNPSELPQGSWLWAGAAIGVCIFMYMMGSSLTKEIIGECVDRGNTLQFCNEHGVNWPMVYGWYGLAIFVGLFGLAKAFLPKPDAS